MENENPKRLSVAQLIDRTVTDFLDGRGAWDRRQANGREGAMAHAGAGENGLRRGGAQPDAHGVSIPASDRHKASSYDEILAKWTVMSVNAREEFTPTWVGTAMDPQQEASLQLWYQLDPDLRGKFAPTPSDVAKAMGYQQWRDASDGRDISSTEGVVERWAVGSRGVKPNYLENMTLARPYLRTEGPRPAESSLDQAEQPNAQGREAWRRDGERIRAELGDDPLTHWVAFDRLAVENPAAFEQYKAMENTGQLGRDHPFSHPAGMAVATETLGGPPMSGPTGFALAQAEVRFSDLHDNSDDDDGRQWRSWSKLEREEREQLARDYAADPTRTDRPYEAQVAYFIMMEAGKAHFGTLDKAQQEKIKQDFFKNGGQERNSFHDAVYLDIAKSDLAIDQMPLGAIEAGRGAGLPGFQPDHEAEAKLYNEYVDGLMAEHAKVVALENGEAIRFDEQTLGFQVAQCALQKEIAARGLGSGHDLDQEHHGAKWSYVESRLEDGDLTHSFKHPNHPRGGNVEFTAKGASPAEVGGLEQLYDDPASAWRGLDDEVKVAILTDHIEDPGNFPHPFEPQIRGEIAALAAIAERHNLVDEIRAAKQERGGASKEQEHPAEVSLGR